MTKRRLPSDTQNCGPPEIDYTKLPARCLLKTRDLPGPKEAKLWNEVLIVLPIDILLLTVEDWEFLSCVSHLNPGYFRSNHGNLGTVYFGKMGTGPTFLKIAVMKCHSGPLTPGGALITVKNGVEVLRPKAVFCVGFCGGLRKKKVSLGDVAISAKLRTYSSITTTDNGIQERGLAVPLEKNLLNLIKNADDGWKAPLKDSSVVKVCKDGVYLSGPEKVESEGRREELVKRFPDAIAIEMEGQGESLAKVQQRDCSVFLENSPSGKEKS